MKTALVTITPKQAKTWLSANNPKNRNMRYRLVDKYAADMRNGSWHVSHQGIAFYCDGSIADGQHRLAAIIAANVEIEMLVTFDLPRESGKAVDQHSQRQAHDALRIGGAPEWLTKDAIAVVRTLANSLGSTQLNLSPDQIEAYAKEFESQIRFVESCFSTKRKNLTASGVRACCVTALVAGEHVNFIRRFAEILMSGEISGPHENAAIRLREYLLSNDGAWSGSTRVGTAKRVQRALKLFCESRPINKLYQPEEWAYPCPAASSIIPGLQMTNPTKRNTANIFGEKNDHSSRSSVV
jgi:hypothetical protein